MPGLGQCEVYGSTVADRALDIDVAALRVDDGPADREPKTEATGLIADLARAEEALEQPGLLILGDARTLVADGHAHESAARRGRDEDLGRLGRVLAGVGDEVGQHLTRAPRVGQHAVGAL